MKSRILSIAIAAAIILPVACKKDKPVEEPTQKLSFEISEIYPGADIVEVSPEESTAQVILTSNDESKPAAKAKAPAKEGEAKADEPADTDAAATETAEDSGATSTADVDVKDGSLITEGDDVVAGFVTLDFNNVRVTPTGNVITDATIIKDNLVPDGADGTMDIHITEVEQMNDVVIKDGLPNTHMMKGFVKMNGKTKDFEAPVNINQANGEFQVTGDVEYDRSHFFDDKAFGHLTADDLANDRVKVRVKLNSKGGKISIYDQDKKIREKIKVREHEDYMNAKIVEKGKGFETRDHYIQNHERTVERLKENNADGKNNARIVETDKKTLEVLNRKQKRMEDHREKLLVKQNEIKERLKDNNKEEDQKELISITQKLDRIDAQIKEVDEYGNRLKAKAESTDGGLNNPNAAGDQEPVDVEDAASE